MPLTPCAQLENYFNLQYAILAHNIVANVCLLLAKLVPY
jgi:hypothetical protein